MAGKTFYEIQTNFSDSISDLAFADQQRYLAATSWDGMICVWEFNNDYSSQTIKIEYKDNKTAYLRCCFSPQCDSVFFGTSHGDVCHFPINAPKGQTPNKIFEHSGGPIVGLKFCIKKSFLVALTLDLSVWIISFTDSNCIKLNIGSKPINMDISDSYLAIAALGPCIYFLNFDDPLFASNPQSTIKALPTQLQYQIKSISMSKVKPDRMIIGSIYGQVEIRDGNTNYIAECHREAKNGNVYPSNSVAMVADNPWAISAGGNGALRMIHIEKPKGGRDFPFNNNGPLTCVAVSSKGEVAAVAQGYDWSLGAEFYKTNRIKVTLFIKKLQSQEF